MPNKFVVSRNLYHFVSLLGACYSDFADGLVTSEPYSYMVMEGEEEKDVSAAGKGSKVGGHVNNSAANKRMQKVKHQDTVGLEKSRLLSMPPLTQTHCYCCCCTSLLKMSADFLLHHLGARISSIPVVVTVFADCLLPWAYP